MGRKKFPVIRARPRFKQCVISLFVVLVVVWICCLLTREDPCRGRKIQALLCDSFARGEVAGKFCEDLCVRKTMTLDSCESAIGDQLLFHAILPSKTRTPAKDHVFVKLTPAHRYSSGLNLSASVYAQPVKGVPMTAFKDMLVDYLKVRLGKAASAASLNTLCDRLMDAADADKDGKVSLAEAKSIWALLKSSDFFASWLFQDSDQVPRLRGFCGGAFVVDHVPVKRLFRPATSSRSVLDIFFPRRHLWGVPSWPHRAKVGVGVLEFIAHIHAHDLAGSFFLCGTSAANVGHSLKHDARFLNLSMLISRETLAASLTLRPCRSADDCQLTPHCTTMCDESAERCTGDIVRPNLHLGCKMLEEYLLHEAPTDVGEELRRLFARCSVLESKSDRVDVETTLLLNEIKTVLWKRISNSPSI